MSARFTTALLSAVLWAGSASGQVAGTAAAAAPQAAQPVRYLAANCANCHGTSGRSTGAMPSLAGHDAATLLERLRQFRDGKRPATVMHQIARGYTDEQLAAIAAHFGAQKQ
jgi:cytochrome c553